MQGSLSCFLSPTKGKGPIFGVLFYAVKFHT